MNYVYSQQSEGLNRYSLEDLVVKKCCDLHQKMQLTFPLMFFILLVWLVQASKLFNLLGCQKVVTYKL